MMNISQTIRRARQLRGDEPAVIDGTTLLSWNVFADRIAKLASFLNSQGVEVGDRVVLLGCSSHRYLEAYFAVPWAGAIIVPANVRLSGPELFQMIKNADPKVIITDEIYINKMPSVMADNADTSVILIRDEGVDYKSVDFLDYEEGLKASTPMEALDRDGDDIAAIIYTSGATGDPKGVMLSHHNIIFNGLNTVPYLKTSYQTVQLHAGPLFHTGAGQRVFTATMAAATHVVLPKFTPEGFCNAVQTHKVNAVQLIPTMMKMILDYPALDQFDLSSLKYISYGGSAMSASLLERIRARFPWCHFSQSYGMTELSPVATSLTNEEHDLRGGGGSLTNTVGRAVMAAEVKIIDEKGAEVPLGSPGEITVSGPNVMKGYWRRPDLTSQVLKDGWMHTGDIGFMDEKGYVTLLDRKKDMIITGGENVYSNEVEEVIRRFEGVKDCSVISVQDPYWGERVHAVLVVQHGQIINNDEIKKFCRQYLADYKVPRSFSEVSELPLNAANKVDKNALRATL